MAGAVALVLVLVQTWRAQADSRAWEALTIEGVREGDVDAMERALVQVRGTSAEPMLTYMTAQRLYELGGPGNFERARSLAGTALSEHPDHPLAGDFELLAAAIDSFAVAPAPDEGLSGIPGNLGF
jgi:hypothetical protein